VQGYDAAQFLAAGLEAGGGSLEDEDKITTALEAAKVESPKGPIRMSAQHNVVQDIYSRKVISGQNRVMGTILTQLADPGTGCKMG
jgi:branched-chain amino acid transport system substrate-binding protein